MKRFLFLGIAATAMLASCTNDEMVEMNPQSAIGFETFVDKSTRAATDVTTDNLTAFWVYGWRTKGTTTEQIFNAQEVTANKGVCTYTSLQYWVGGYKYNFEAVAPQSDNNSVTFNAANGASTITFVSDSETDLIYATGSKDLTSTTNLTETPGAVELVFNHLLSRVKFSFVNGFPANSDVKLTVTDVKINDAVTTAICTPSTKTWATAIASSIVNFASTAVGNISGKESAETEHKYLIPADIKNYTVSFTVKMTQGGVYDTFNHTVTLSTDDALELEAGKSYDLTATLDAQNINPNGDLFPIEFTAIVTSWDDFNNVTIP